MTGDILAERDRQMALRRAEFLRFENLAQVDLLALAVGYLDSDHRLARHRRLNPHRRRPQRHRKVVGKIDDLAHLDARARLELVHRDDRPRLNLDHAPLDAEVGQLLLEHARTAFQCRSRRLCECSSGGISSSASGGSLNPPLPRGLVARFFSRGGSASACSLRRTSGVFRRDPRLGNCRIEPRRRPRASSRSTLSRGTRRIAPAQPRRFGHRRSRSVGARPAISASRRPAPGSRRYSRRRS